jgi:hypothetical protein
VEDRKLFFCFLSTPCPEAFRKKEVLHKVPYLHRTVEAKFILFYLVIHSYNSTATIQCRLFTHTSFPVSLFPCHLAKHLLIFSLLKNQKKKNTIFLDHEPQVQTPQAQGWRHHVPIFIPCPFLSIPPPLPIPGLPAKNTARLAAAVTLLKCEQKGPCFSPSRFPFLLRKGNSSRSWIRLQAVATHAAAGVGGQHRGRPAPRGALHVSQLSTRLLGALTGERIQLAGS